MPQETCPHGKNAPSEVIDGLPHSQAGIGRHKCVVCAYCAGVNDSRGSDHMPAGHIVSCDHNREPLIPGVSHAHADTIADLPESQAGLGRHKCAICAYQAGFQRAGL